MNPPTPRIPFNPRIAVVSLYDHHQAKLADITHPNHEAYCRHNGYTYISHVGRIDLSCAASWSKLLLVSRVLPMFDAILWIDTDTVFQLKGGIETYVTPHFSATGLILCHAQPSRGETAKEANPNFGVVLFKNVQKTQELIFKIYAQYYQKDYPWAEQQAVISLKEWGMRELDIAPRGSFVSYPEQENDCLIYHAYGPCDKEQLCRLAIKAMA